MLREMAASFVEMSPVPSCHPGVLAGKTIDMWVTRPGVKSTECLSSGPGVSWALAPPGDSEMRREGDSTARLQGFP